MTSDPGVPGQNPRCIPRLDGVSVWAAHITHMIVDIWGVLHDGRSLFQPAVDALVQARAAGLQTCLLSNAPRSRAVVRDHLLSMGFPKALTDLIVTSGALARDMVRSDWQGAAMYHMGPISDRDAAVGLPVTDVSDIAAADFIFATGLDFPTQDQHRPMLEAARARDLPFLCANPDRVVHDQGRLLYCAGYIADLYEALGGSVHWFGKPNPVSYLGAMKEMGLAAEAAGPAILMVGDSLQTDIAGANAVGVSSLHIAGGINRALYAGAAKGVNRQDLYEAAQASGLPLTPYTPQWGPDAFMDQLCW